MMERTTNWMKVGLSSCLFLMLLPAWGQEKAWPLQPGVHVGSMVPVGIDLRGTYGWGPYGELRVRYPIPKEPLLVEAVGGYGRASNQPQ